MTHPNPICFSSRAALLATALLALTSPSPAQQTPRSPSVTTFGTGFPTRIVPPEVTLSGLPLGGATLTVGIRGGQPNQGGYIALGPFSATPLPGLGGHKLYFQSIPSLSFLRLGPLGEAQLPPQSIPAAANLIGVDLAAQGIYFDGSLGAGFLTTRALVCRLGDDVPGPLYARPAHPMTLLAERTRTADLNGDGLDDVVSWEIGGANEVEVMLADGNGFLEQPHLVPIFAQGTGGRRGGGTVPVHDVALADVTGDGKVDIVAVNGGDQLAVAAGNGDGTFQAAVILNHTTGSRLEVVATADLNGDGKPEAIALDDDFAGPSLVVFDNNGTGGFTARPTTLAIPGNPRLLELRDVNGDTWADALVLRDAGLSGSELLVANGSAGGGFQAAQTYSLPGICEDFAIADMDGDGNPDVVLALQNNVEQVSVLYGTSFGVYSFQSNFATLLPLPANWDAERIAVGDLDRDGALDIAVARRLDGQEGVAIFRQTGPRTFGTAEFRRLGNRSRGLEVAVLAGDGSRTLVHVGRFNSFAMLPDATEARVDSALLLPQQASRVFPLEDLTGDGIPDLLVIEKWGFSNPQLSIGPGIGDGTFGALVNLPGNNADPVDVVHVDLDGDGDLDLAALQRNPEEVQVLENDGQGNFTALTPMSVGAGFGSSVQCIRAGDISDDGRPDLLVVCRGTDEVRYFENTGALMFSAQPSFPTGSQPEEIALGDLNGDGKLDLIVGMAGTDEVSTQLRFGPALFGPSSQQAIAGNPYALSVADHTGDGIPDVVVTCNSSSDGLQLLAGSANGTLAAPVTLLAEVQDGGLHSVEVTGDGILDLILPGGAGADPDCLAVLAGIGNGTFADPLVFDTGIRQTIRSTAVGDLDQDGLPDVVVGSNIQQTGVEGLPVLLHQRGGRK